METVTFLIGLGKGGSALLPYLLAKPQFRLVAACDSNPDAIGVAMAQRCGLLFYQEAVEGVKDLQPDLVVDATGDPSLASTLYEVRPAGTSVVTGEASRLLWELLSAQEQQRRCELRFGRLMDDMLSGLVVVQDSRIKFINRAFQEMLGHPRRDLLGHPYRSILHESVQERDLGFHHARTHGEQPSREYDSKVVHADGSVREVQVRVRLSDWEGRPASLVIMSDVTELRRLQRERERFFRYMVHELRAPLSPVATTITLLRDPAVIENAERRERLLSVLSRSTDRLQTFVTEFLELSRIEEQMVSVSHKPLDLRRIMEEVVESQRLLADDKGLALSVQPGDDVAVVGDEFIVETIVRNLVNNAVKYTETGSVTVSVEAAGDRFSIRVADTGPGLSAGEQKLVFREFGRIERSAGIKGTGLGLALVKKLAEAAGGRAWVESEGKGHGCTFGVDLPVQFADGPPRPEPAD